MSRSKKTWLIVLGVIALAAIAGSISIGMRVATTVNHALRISELLQPVLDAKNQTMHIVISAEVNGDPFAVESDIFLVSEDDVSYLAVEQKGTAVYITNNVLFLENGKAFRIGDTMQTKAESYAHLLPQIKALYEVLKITPEETSVGMAYSITVTGEQMATLLAAASFGDALPAEGIETLKLNLTEKDGKLDIISFAGTGELNGSAVELNVMLSGFRILASGDYPIPEEVKKSAATVNPEELLCLTEDLYKLVLAMDSFSDMESMDAVLKLTVDCGLIQLDSQMNLSDMSANSSGQLDPEKLQALPEVLGWLCMEGDISCTSDGDTCVYMLALDQDAMKDLSRMILPELAQYGGDLTEGSVSVVLKSGKITSMNLSIDGKISALIAQIPIAVDADITFG